MRQRGEYVSSAALPAYDILLLGLQILDDKLKFEIIDMLYGFAICIPKGTYTGWQSQLRKKWRQINQYSFSPIKYWEKNSRKK